jgi:SPRY domain-containing SOCS box protein 3
MMFGVGTKQARVHVDAFLNLLGEDDKSWGLSHKGFTWHDGKSELYTKPFRENVATTIGIYFDGLNGNLTYFKDGVNLGIAFTGLHEEQEPLYPIVCSTAAKTEMALGVMKRDFGSLQDRCRMIVIRHLTREEQIDELMLPSRLRQFISEGLEDFSADVQLSQNNLS